MPNSSLPSYEAYLQTTTSSGPSSRLRKTSPTQNWFKSSCNMKKSWISPLTAQHWPPTTIDAANHHIATTTTGHSDATSPAPSVVTLDTPSLNAGRKPSQRPTTELHVSHLHVSQLEALQA